MFDEFFLPVEQPELLTDTGIFYRQLGVEGETEVAELAPEPTAGTLLYTF